MEYIVPAIACVSMALLLVAGWMLTLLSLPGTWLIVVAAAIYSYLVPDQWRVDVGWLTVGVLFALAVLGEVIETLTAAVGARRAGARKSSAFLSLCGSILGGIGGGVLGFPIPVVGPLIAVVLGAAFGAMAGAMIGEQWQGRPAEENWEVGKAAFWGRLMGTLGKIGVASVMVAIVLMALVLA
ncbi:MAG: DUF456 family protein [Planctomycetota bacterium]